MINFVWSPPRACAQVVAADAIGVNHVLLAASNVCGGAFGHMLSTSSMVVAAVSSGSDAKSVGPIARSVIVYALVLITLFCSWNILVVRWVGVERWKGRRRCRVPEGDRWGWWRHARVRPDGAAGSRETTHIPYTYHSPCPPTQTYAFPSYIPSADYL